MFLSWLMNKIRRARFNLNPSKHLLKYGGIYEGTYSNWKNDQKPCIFVMFSGEKYTHALNLNYLTQHEKEWIGRVILLIKKGNQNIDGYTFYKMLKLQKRSIVQTSYRMYHTNLLNMKQIGMGFTNNFQHLYRTNNQWVIALNDLTKPDSYTDYSKDIEVSYYPEELQDRILEAHNSTSIYQNKALSFLLSPGGLTIALMIAVAAFAAMDKGFYIIVNTIVTGGMWALMAMGLALIFGVMNIPNFAHGEYFMIGTLVAYFVITPFTDFIGENPYSILAAIAPLFAIGVATAAGGLAGALSELVVFRPLRRRSQEAWVMNSFLLTVGLSVFMVNGYQLIFGNDFRGIVNYWYYDPISFFDVYISIDRLAVFLIAVVVMACFWGFMKYSTMGRAIRAVSQDETGALMVGINLNLIQIITIALSCALAALAGACLIFMFPSYPRVGLAPLYNSWFIVIVVGLGNVGAAVVGGFLVALLQVLTTVYVGEGWNYVFPSLLIILILIIKPSGIFGSEIRGVHDQ